MDQIVQVRRGEYLTAADWPNSLEPPTTTNTRSAFVFTDSAAAYAAAIKCGGVTNLIYRGLPAATKCLEDYKQDIISTMDNLILNEHGREHIKLALAAIDTACAHLRIAKLVG